MSVNTIDMLVTADEVQFSSADLLLSAQEEASPPELAASSGFSLPPGLSLPIEVPELTPELKQLIDEVGVELTRRAENFASSHLMTEDDDLEFEYLTTMLPPGLSLPPGLMEDSAGECSESYTEDNADCTTKMDGDESSDESTKADSQPDPSTKAESGSGTASVVSDEEEDDESNDEVPELPDLSAEGMSLRKQGKIQAKKIANAEANNSKATTRIVYGDKGAKLAAQAALVASVDSCGYGSTENMMTWQAPPGSWQPPLGSTYGWHPYYGYVAW